MKGIFIIHNELLKDIDTISKIKPFSFNGLRIYNVSQNGPKYEVAKIQIDQEVSNFITYFWMALTLKDPEYSWIDYDDLRERIPEGMKMVSSFFG